MHTAPYYLAIIVINVINFSIQLEMSAQKLESIQKSIEELLERQLFFVLFLYLFLASFCICHTLKAHPPINFDFTQPYEKKTDREGKRTNWQPKLSIIFFITPCANEGQ